MHEVEHMSGCFTLLPYNSKGKESRWQLSRDNLLSLLNEGFVKVNKSSGKDPWSVTYLSSGQRKQIEDGDMIIVGKDDDGSVRVEYKTHKTIDPKTQWRLSLIHI